MKREEQGTAANGAGGALAGLRVVDFGQYIAGPLAAMILADNGADVVRVDPPGGPRWNHDSNAILQRGKRSIVLDLAHDGDRQVARDLMDRADVVIENFRPGVMHRLGLGPDDALERNPGLVYCSLPGFSRDDPRAGLAAWEGILGAATGHYAPGVALAWGDVAPVDPSFSALPLASTFGAFIGVNSVLAALLARQRTGRGQQIEVPLFGAMLEGIGMAAQRLPVPQTPYGHQACAIQAQAADGRWVYLVMSTRAHYRRFARSFFPPQLHELGIADPVRLEQDDALAALAREQIEQLLSTRTAEEWDHVVNAAGLPFAICQSTEEWIADPDAEAAHAVVAVRDPELGDTRQAGHPVTLAGTPSVLRARRPLDGDRESVLAESRAPLHRASSPVVAESLDRALDGVTVVDLSLVLAAPLAGRVLAEFGADVIKINQPGYWIVGHLTSNNGKRTALVDVRTDEGKELLWSLVRRADVLLENFSGGTAERIGLGSSDARRHRPDLVYCSVSTYNRDGRRGGFRGYEPLGQVPTGMMLRWGGDRPRMYRFTVCDYGTGHLAATAILLGLYHRARTGEGQDVQASLVQTGTFHQLPFVLEYEGRPAEAVPAGREAKGWNALDRLYQASDGWFYLAALGHGEADALRGVLDLDELDADQIAARFAEAPVDSWVTALTEAGVTSHPLVAIDEMMDDPAVQRQGFSIEREYRDFGTVRTIGPVPRMSETPVVPAFAVGPPGADTRAVALASGMAPEHYEQLLDDGVVGERLEPHEIIY